MFILSHCLYQFLCRRLYKKVDRLINEFRPQNDTSRPRSDRVHEHARSILGLLRGHGGGLARGAVCGRAALPAVVRGVRARAPHDRGRAQRGRLLAGAAAATAAARRGRQPAASRGRAGRQVGS